MNQLKITTAIARLEQNLPLRLNQIQLAEELRQLHKDILRHYLEFGRAPSMEDIDYAGDWLAAVRRLAIEKIIVIDEVGVITGAYPFNDEARGFRVVSDYGETNAMCAFDALAISSMFDLPTRIKSCCRVAGNQIVIEQDDKQLRVTQPNTVVFAAIGWGAQSSSKSCSATLCTEMTFIAGDAAARAWFDANPENRQLFRLDEAHQLITSVFLPLVQ